MQVVSPAFSYTKCPVKIHQVAVMAACAGSGTL